MSPLLEIAKKSRVAVKNNSVKRIENGEYDVVVSDIELRSRKDGQGSYFLISLKIVSEEYKDEIIPEIVSFHPYRINSSMYKLEEMLESCKINLSDESYKNTETLYESIKEELLQNKIRIRFYFRTGFVRIDYLHKLDNDTEEADVEIDLSEILF